MNRASDSGTRFLLEGLLNERQIAETDIHGFEQSAGAHAGVAAYVASELADAGFDWSALLAISSSTLFPWSMNAISWCAGRPHLTIR
ncbi:MAG: hypothetical protein IPI09_20340 [Burkholderiales bacterium]|nr:hypothetical protein [Burkholderiales bacterium]